MASVPGSMGGMIGRLVGMTRGDGLRAQLLRGGMGSVAVKIVATALSFAVAVVLARVLGPEGYGIYAYAFALVSLLAIPAQFGLPNLVIRETAKAHANEDWGLMRGIWRWATGMAGAISLALALLAGGLAWAFADRFGEMQLATFAWGLLLVPLIALTAVLGAAVRGLSHVISGQISENLLRPLLLLVFLLASFMWPATVKTSLSAMHMHAAAALLAMIVGWRILQNSMPTAMKNTSNIYYNPQIWVRATLPLAVVSSVHLLTRTADVLLIGIFLPASDVGYFRAAAQIALIIAFVSEAFNLVIAPYFAQSYATQDVKKSVDIVRFNIAANISFAIPIGLIIILLNDNIVNILFGIEYKESATILQILAISQIITSSLGISGLLLSISGYERIVARVLVLSIIINIILNIILIPQYGTVGAAWSTVLASVTWVGILLGVTKKKIDLDIVNIIYKIFSNLRRIIVSSWKS